MKTQSNLPPVLQAKEEDIKMLLAAQSHLGSKNSQIGMSRYVYKTRPDGVNIINIGSTWEKLVLAARIIAAVENPQDVVVISSRNYGQRAALKFASNTGAIAVVGRFTPGTFTNYITRAFREPRLIIVTDPLSDHQAILESSYVNVPVIAFADVDSTLKHIDVAIPINNKGKHSVGVAWWLLAREVLRLRGTISRDEPWSVMVDMFFYRDPEEQKKEEELQEESEAQVGEDADATASVQLPGAGNENWDGEWTGESAAAQDWAEATPVAAGDSSWD